MPAGPLEISNLIDQEKTESGSVPAARELSDRESGRPASA